MDLLSQALSNPLPVEKKLPQLRPLSSSFASSLTAAKDMVDSAVSPKIEKMLKKTSRRKLTALNSQDRENLNNNQERNIQGLCFKDY